jgi:hypothetical protein
MIFFISAQRCGARRFGVVMVSVVAGLFFVTAAVAQGEGSPSSAPPSGSQSDTKTPSRQEREDFRLKMSKTPLPSKGCFTAHYPIAIWQRENCGPAPQYPNPIARGARPTFVGGGNDYFLEVTGDISSATGAFDSVTVNKEYGSRLGDKLTEYPNTYSLQLNANVFSTAACGGAPMCVGWQQFLFSQSQCSPVPTPCIFMEYWLLNHGSPCPAGGWIYSPPAPGTLPGCFLNTAFALVPGQPLTQLGDLKLTGTVSGGIDTVLLSTASGDIVATAQDSLLGLASGWTGSEFNLVGDCCLSEAYFNSGSSLTVRLSAANGTTNPPSCVTAFQGATGETNNLNLTSACSPVGGASPAIVFTESGGGPVPPGVSIGDTHLTTFRGVHYDFQASGDFVLVQSDPDFVVQSRQSPLQRPFSLPPIASVNTSVCTKMGNTQVEISLTGIEVNGAHTPLNDGQSLSLPGAVTISRRGNIYVVSRPSGDILQGHLMGGYIDVSVTLGVTNPATVRGLLAGNENGLVMRDGTVLKPSISWPDWVRYADSWRVGPADSQLCKGQISSGMPQKPIYAEEFPPQERERVQAICSKAGVKGDLLEDCMLDVSFLKSDSAADVFVYAPRVSRVVKPLPPIGP